MAEYVEKRIACQRLVDKALKEQLRDECAEETTKECLDLIRSIPAADVVPVVHGRWEPRTDAIGFVRCSVCRDCNIYDGWADGKKWNYCPNCGAKMDGDKDD